MNDIWLDPHYWSDYFSRIYKRQTTYYCDSILNRVLPTFDNIDKEADNIANEEYERFMGQSVDEYSVDDSAKFAETAEESGIEYYQLLSGVRQGILNMATVGLHHLFEQQLLFFHSKQVLLNSEENQQNLVTLKEFHKRLKKGGILIEELNIWKKIDELRLVANSIKHGEGVSSKELRKIRTDLFIYPGARNDEIFKNYPSSFVYMPMQGKDIYIDIDDFKKYRDSVLLFWDDFGDLILKNDST